MSLGSNASYDLNIATTRYDNCASTNMTVAALACGSTVPFQTNAFVSVSDDGLCSSSADKLCNFSPQNVTVSTSGRVNWQSFGRLNHTVTSDTPGIFDFTLSLHPLPLNSTFLFNNLNRQFTFSSAGDFSYHCKFHPWMKGTVIVVQPTPLPAKVQSFALSGPVGWTVAGLDDSAQLDVHHQTSEYNASSTPPQKLYNESGVSGDTIDLSTRKDSSLGSNPLQFINSVPFQTGGGVLYGGYSYGYPFYYTPLEVYTVWWVNGPLKVGSTVEVLTFHSAVRASESVNLGSSLGSHDAWVVSSTDSQAFNQTQPSSQNGYYYCYTPYYGQYLGFSWNNPSPQCYTSGSSNSVTTRLDYGQQSDLLFSLNAAVDTYTQTTTIYPPGSFLYANGPYQYYPGITVTSKVNVVRTSRATTMLSLKLSSTSLDLASRTVPPSGGSGTSTTSNPVQLAVPLWMYGTASIFSAALVSAGILVVLRARRKRQTAQASQPPPNLPS